VGVWEVVDPVEKVRYKFLRLVSSTTLRQPILSRKRYVEGYWH
jgi:hypothetical protein